MLKLIKGDKSIWALCLTLILYSFVIVYSSSSNIAFQYHGGNNLSVMLKHLVHVLMGLGFMISISHIPSKFFKNSSVLIYILTLVLLLLAMFTGTTIGNANASRWVNIFGFTFQPSEMAKVSLIMILARNLVKHRGKLSNFKQSFIPIVLPIVIMCLLVVRASLSAAMFLYAVSMVILFLGNYPVKNILKICGLASVTFGLFITIIMVVPNISNRVDTWKGRIERYIDDVDDPDANYQIEHSKMALMTGGMTGIGPGKSKQKYFLPQSNSDFIFAIMVEEYGFIFGCILPILLFLWLFIRFIITSLNTKSDSGKLLVFGLGFSLIFQAFLNMGVAVELLPVTGQTLPLISAGGSSIWMTCSALGIILSISQVNIDRTKKELKLITDKATANMRRAKLEAEQNNDEVFDAQAFLKSEISRLKNETK